MAGTHHTPLARRIMALLASGIYRAFLIVLPVLTIWVAVYLRERAGSALAEAFAAAVLLALAAAATRLAFRVRKDTCRPAARQRPAWDLTGAGACIPGSPPGAGLSSGPPGAAPPDGSRP